MNEVDAEIAAGFADSYRRIERVIKQIPRGRVMTYGSVAAEAGLGRAARLVGYALHKIYPFVPWHRVLGKRAKNIAQVAIKDALLGARQRALLEAEGVLFSASAGVELERYGFQPGMRDADLRGMTTPTQKKAQKKVRKVMHEFKEGTLRSGGSGKKVRSRKQAIAIGLSEARRAGAKLPRKKAKSR